MAAEPKLTVRLMEIAGMASHKTIMLCDAEGTPLPGQRASVLKDAVGEPAELTITFIVDGSRVRFAD